MDKPTLPTPQQLDYIDLEITPHAYPWSARLFNLTLTLAKQGYFSLSEFQSQLSQCLVEAASQQYETSKEDYYDHWLTTLLSLLGDKGILASLLMEQAASVSAPSPFPVHQPSADQGSKSRLH